MKSFIFTLTACAAIAMPAAEEVLFRSDFKHDRELKGWFDVGNSYIQGVPQTKPTKGLRFGKTIEDGSVIILKADVNSMGMTHLFSKPVLVDDNLKSLTLKIVFRQNPKAASGVSEFAMTIRDAPFL